MVSQDRFTSAILYLTYNNNYYFFIFFSIPYIWILKIILWIMGGLVLMVTGMGIVLLSLYLSEMAETTFYKLEDWVRRGL